MPNFAIVDRLGRAVGFVKNVGAAATAKRLFFADGAPGMHLRSMLKRVTVVRVTPSQMGSLSRGALLSVQHMRRRR